MQPVALNPVASTQLLTSTIEQFAAFAADCDENDISLIIKLFRLARFIESSGNKIRKVIVDFELYLNMCGCPKHHTIFPLCLARQ